VFDLTCRGICLDKMKSADSARALAFIRELFADPARWPIIPAERPMFFTSITRRSFAVAAFAAIACFAATPAPGADELPVRPPFGLEWGESAIPLEQALLGAGGKIVERAKGGGGTETWQVEGLPQLALRRAVFELRDGKLTAVELQYGKDDWTAANYDGFVQNVRQRIEEKRGAGKLIARKQETERGILQTLLGYRWDLPSGSLELVYFAAQNPANLYRTVSLRYAAPPPAAAEKSAP
jgi:hypothetical protein